ncbi:acyl-CoA dehydrogenase family protein [Roseiarcaceae bacterium H3SJ34-1]|nr:acyl-CoA dehydrogenase family protein [Roseiarcaceae bacterium H3SJ34-1]
MAALSQAILQALPALDAYLAAAKQRVRHSVSLHGVDDDQRAVHGLAWLAAYTQAIREIASFNSRQQHGAITQLLGIIAAGEYLAQCFTGLPMSQTEIVRPSDFGFTRGEADAFRNDAVDCLTAGGNSAATRAALIDFLRQSADLAAPFETGQTPELQAMQREVARFADAEIAPAAQGWHLDNAYIPLETIDRLASLGVFGLTIAEHYGGLGLGKTAMCIVTEELSRGYIGAGSLGTRSEIAAELIMHGGSEAQKQKYLPGIAAGEIIPTAVFTEPDAGSDLASLRTRAVRQVRSDGDTYSLRGAKTWITHAARADLMIVLARTGALDSGHRGLSIFLVDKPRGTEADPFPLENLSGSEIEVLGYRGMKEFELSFDDLAVPAGALLGEVEGLGFRQLMQTFESARIQTAARATGVARSAFELAFRYALERRQFGRPLIGFPRVADKLALMAAEIHAARLLTHFAAQAKDAGARCDLEAGMAKLLAARVAWSAADNSVQIHGGNGFALEFPVSRILCDARILSIFEGAAEIQAHVIGRRLLEGE